MTIKNKKLTTILLTIITSMTILGASYSSEAFAAPGEQGQPFNFLGQQIEELALNLTSQLNQLAEELRLADTNLQDQIDSIQSYRLFKGNGDPSPETGTTNDNYLDLQTGTLWMKGETGWMPVKTSRDLANIVPLLPNPGSPITFTDFGGGMFTSNLNILLNNPEPQSQSLPNGAIWINAETGDVFQIKGDDPSSQVANKIGTVQFPQPVEGISGREQVLQNDPNASNIPDDVDPELGYFAVNENNGKIFQLVQGTIWVHFATLNTSVSGGGGTPGPQGEPGNDGQDGPRFGFSPTTDACLADGIQIQIWRDTNNNDVFDDFEDGIKPEVCDGQDGIDGQDGKTPTITFEIIPEGEVDPDCLEGGGVQIQIWLDDNNNGVFDGFEDGINPKVCNGKDGVSIDDIFRDEDKLIISLTDDRVVEIPLPQPGTVITDISIMGDKFLIKFSDDTEKTIPIIDIFADPGVVDELQFFVPLCSVIPTPDGAQLNCPDGSFADIFNGQDGIDGLPGTDGQDGSTGSPGTDGQDGQSFAIAVTAEPAGINCEFGGNKIVAGPDQDVDGQPDVITATAYVCNGADGAGGQLNSFDVIQVLDVPTGVSEQIVSCGVPGATAVLAGLDVPNPDVFVDGMRPGPTSEQITLALFNAGVDAPTPFSVRCLG